MRLLSLQPVFNIVIPTALEAAGEVRVHRTHAHLLRLITNGIEREYEFSALNLFPESSVY